MNADYTKFIGAKRALFEVLDQVGIDMFDLPADQLQAAQATLQAWFDTQYEAGRDDAV